MAFYLAKWWGTDKVERFHYVFKNLKLLEQALTHKSYRNENTTAVVAICDNERLEFLGDAVLDLALSEILMRRFPGDQEGGLSKKRASLVNEETLAKLALEVALTDVIRLGKGERQSGGEQKPRILASTFEAVIGAIFLDGGFNNALEVVEKIFDPHLTGLEGKIDFQQDFKTRLQEKVQEKYRAIPLYQVENEVGPDHDKQFEVSVRLDGRVLASGQGRSKKSAEQDAARKALEQFK